MNMKSIRRLQGWLLSLSVIIILPACGGGGGSTADTNPPRFIEVRITPSVFIEGETARAEASVTDLESAISQVRIRLHYPNGYTETYQMQRQSSSNWFVTEWTVPSGTTSNQNTVRIILTAEDAHGNRRDIEYTPPPRLIKQPPNPPSW